MLAVSLCRRKMLQKDVKYENEALLHTALTMLSLSWAKFYLPVTCQDKLIVPIVC